MLPSAVVSSDLKPEVEQATAQLDFAKVIVSFIGGILGNKRVGIVLQQRVLESEAILKPLIDAMILEGSYNIKEPCYDHTLVNERGPKCLHGNHWSEIAQGIMAGELKDKHVELHTDDNFHRVYTITPVHLPQTNNTCDGKTQCTLESITVTENYYNRLSPFDTGSTEIGAVEMKAKLLSRQKVQHDAGNTTADFHEMDEVGNRCADINKDALQYALDHASKKAIKRYNSLGKKLVIGDDLGPYNEGPLWIWTYMSYKDNADKTETTVSAPMMRTPIDYPIGAAAGFHYCKLLSPFRAMEWIYIDALYDRDGINKNGDDKFDLFMQ